MADPNVNPQPDVFKSSESNLNEIPNLNVVAGQSLDNIINNRGTVSDMMLLQKAMQDGHFGFKDIDPQNFLPKTFSTYNLPTGNSALDRLNEFNNAGVEWGQEYDNIFGGMSTRSINLLDSKTIQPLERYKLHMDYDKLGYSPFRDNDAIYNTYGSTFGDVMRSVGGFWDVAVLGWNNYLDADLQLSSWSQAKNAERFEEITKMRMSQKNNKWSNFASPFLGNTFMQVGLSLGMMAGMGTSIVDDIRKNPKSVFIGAAKGLKALPKLDKAGKLSTIGYESYLSQFKQPNKLRKIWQNVNQKVWDGTKWVIEKPGRLVAPSTAKVFSKNVRTPYDILRYNHKTFPALYFDTKVATAALAEGQLEAGLVQNRVMKEGLEKLEKSGKPITQEELDDLITTSHEAAQSTAFANVPVILATNGLILRTAFLRPLAMRVGMNTGVTKKIISENPLYKAVATPFSKAKVVSKKTARQKLSDIGTTIVTPKKWKSGIAKSFNRFGKYSLVQGGLMEGGQELYQEIVGDTAAEGYLDHYFKLYEKGERYKSPEFGDFISHLGNNLKKYTSPQGFEIFASGFLMGGMASGVISTVTTPIKMLRNYTDRVFNNETYEEYKTRMEKKAQEDVDAYNAYTADPFRFFNSPIEHATTVKSLANEAIEATLEGDEKGAIDARNEAVNEHMFNLYEKGGHEEFLNYLDEILEEDFTVEEFNEAMGTNHDTIEEARDSIKSMKKRISDAVYNIEKAYDTWGAPYDPNAVPTMLLDENGMPYLNPEYIDRQIKHQAHKDFIKTVALGNTTFNEAVNRRLKIHKNIIDNFNFLEVVEENDIRNILSLEDMRQEDTILSQELIAINDKEKAGAVLSKEEKADKKRLEKKKELLNSLREAVEGYQATIAEEDSYFDEEIGKTARYTEEQEKQQKKALKGLYGAFNKYINYLVGESLNMPSGKMRKYRISQDQVDEIFKMYKDSIELDNDAKMYGAVLRYLSNPDTYVEWHARREMVRAQQYKANQELSKKHYNAALEKVKSSQLIFELSKLNMFLDDEGLKSVFDELDLPEYFILKKDDDTFVKIRKEDQRYTKPAKLVSAYIEDFAAESGFETFEAFDKANREASLEREKQEREAKRKQKKKKTVDEILTLLDSDGLSNRLTWPDTIQQQAELLFAKFQKNNPDRFANIDEWIESRPDDVLLLIDDHNEQVKQRKAQKKGGRKKKEDIDPTEEKPTDEDISMPFSGVSKSEGHKKLKKVQGTEIKQISSMTDEEALEFGVKTTDHGYFIKINGKWVRSTSMTSIIGMEMDPRTGNKVRVKATGQDGILGDELADLEDQTAEPVWEVKLEDGSVVQMNQSEFDLTEYEDNAFAGNTLDAFGKEFFEGVPETTASYQGPVVYSGIFFNTDELVAAYGQVLANLFSHHSTIEFKPSDVSDLPIGQEMEIRVVGRLTTDKVDVLLVDNPLSKNEFPHITLSTAEGVKPFQSNEEIKNNRDKIQPLNDVIKGTVGVFDGKSDITSIEKTKPATEPVIPTGPTMLDLTDAAKKQLVKAFEDLAKEIKALGWEFVMEGPLVFDKNPPTGQPVGGEIDLLFWDPVKKRYEIVDIKSSVNPAINRIVKSTGEMILTKGYTEPDYMAKIVGERISKREQHGYQQSGYKNMLENITSVRSNMNIASFDINLDKENRQITKVSYAGMIRQGPNFPYMPFINEILTPSTVTETASPGIFGTEVKEEKESDIEPIPIKDADLFLGNESLLEDLYEGIILLTPDVVERLFPDYLENPQQIVRYQGDDYTFVLEPSLNFDELINSLKTLNPVDEDGNTILSQINEDLSYRAQSMQLLFEVLRLQTDLEEGDTVKGSTIMQIDGTNYLVPNILNNFIESPEKQLVLTEFEFIEEEDTAIEPIDLMEEYGDQIKNADSLQALLAIEDYIFQETKDLPVTRYTNDGAVANLIAKRKTELKGTTAVSIKDIINKAPKNKIISMMHKEHGLIQILTKRITNKTKFIKFKVQETNKEMTETLDKFYTNLVPMKEDAPVEPVTTEEQDTSDENVDIKLSPEQMKEYADKYDNPLDALKDLGKQAKKKC